MSDDRKRLTIRMAEVERPTLDTLCQTLRVSHWSDALRLAAQVIQQLPPDQLAAALAKCCGTP